MTSPTSSKRALPRGIATLLNWRSGAERASGQVH
jgi:hypothetical protein